MVENLNPNNFSIPRSKLKTQVNLINFQNKTYKGDRFIPNRSSTNMDLASFYINRSFSKEDDSPSFNKILADSLLNSQKVDLEKSLSPQSHKVKDSAYSERLMSYRAKKNLPSISLTDEINKNFIYSIRNTDQIFTKYRTISQTAEKILDAPEIIDDYYLNLMDWGENGLLAVALNKSLYLWNQINGEISSLVSTENEDNYICSVSWMNNQSNCLAIGFADNTIQLWDSETSQQIRTLKGHSNRISSLSWNSHVLSSGSRDTYIINHDVRARNNILSIFEGHKQEICGLKWSYDGKTLASGGNDNMLMLWDLNSNRKKNMRYCLNSHTAAVKALSWCPLQKNLLASGGGTADKSIKFWDTDNGNLLSSVGVESQVCSLLWNPFEKEILSSHGFSKNQLILWKYPSMEKVIELNGHSNRVLHLSMGPDNKTVVSAAADETLRFWKVFDGPFNGERKRKKDGILQEGGCNLR